MLAAPLVGVPLVAPALVGLTRKSPRRIAGGFVDDGGAVGHRLRDGTLTGARGPETRVPIVIVGGGMAGLSAGWELRRRGVSDFVILELESVAGGNARSGENEVSPYPWAAHYVPVPSVKSTLVRELFEELGVLRDGVWEERYLCFSPQERLFAHGEWHDGIEPDFALDAAGRAAFGRFDQLIAELRASGEFTIPMADGVRRDSPLDRISMADWLAQHQLDVPAIRWYIDYACRDDYGALARDTSAWAGVHYFASRPHDEQGPLTWPEGNGWIAKRLIAKLADHIRPAEPAVRIERAAGGARRALACGDDEGNVSRRIGDLRGAVVLGAARRPGTRCPSSTPGLFPMADRELDARSLAARTRARCADLLGQRHLRFPRTRLRRRDPSVAAHALRARGVDILLVAGRSGARRWAA